ncbi:MAG: PspC domain-containing protein [Anaerolinea sp.]|nr:PspC domain-containing protein [Anaerolinea sp.]
MLRSFSDRVFGGVCGGIAASLRISGWLVRLLWLLLALISSGVFIIPYVLLWWIIPMESPYARRVRRITLLVPVGLFVLTAAAWIARDQGLLRAPNGNDLLWYACAVIVAFIFLIRQFGGRSRALEESAR